MKTKATISRKIKSVKQVKKALDLAELPLSLTKLPEPPEYAGLQSKEQVVYNWLKELAMNVPAFTALPSSKALAAYLGVSSGVVQNVFRYLRNEGMFQFVRITATVTAPPDGKRLDGKENNRPPSAINHAVMTLSYWLLSSDIMPGDVLPSINDLSIENNLSQTHVRQGLEYMVSQGMLQHVKSSTVANQTKYKYVDQSGKQNAR
jgi:DNA-binding transcriptional regulator YhcF (GntR family)